MRTLIGLLILGAVNTALASGVTTIMALSGVSTGGADVRVASGVTTVIDNVMAGGVSTATTDKSFAAKLESVNTDKDTLTFNLGQRSYTMNISLLEEVNPELLDALELQFYESGREGGGVSETR